MRGKVSWDNRASPLFNPDTTFLFPLRFLKFFQCFWSVISTNSSRNNWILKAQDVTSPPPSWVSNTKLSSNLCNGQSQSLCFNYQQASCSKSPLQKHFPPPSALWQPKKRWRWAMGRPTFIEKYLKKIKNHIPQKEQNQQGIHSTSSIICHYKAWIFSCKTKSVCLKKHLSCFKEGSPGPLRHN